MHGLDYLQVYVCYGDMRPTVLEYVCPGVIAIVNEQALVHVTGVNNSKPY